jgi:hypothetical protein
MRFFGRRRYGHVASRKDWRRKHSVIHNVSTLKTFFSADEYSQPAAGLNG